MRSIRLATAVAICVTGLVAVGATTESAGAAPSKNLQTTYTKVVKGEHAGVSGHVTTADVRTIRLQYRSKSSGPWTTKDSTVSSGSGYFEFAISTSKTRYWRYYAPATEDHSRVYGNPLKISVVAQKVQMFIVSLDNGCSNVTNNITILVDFYPARPGRNVGFATNDGIKADQQNEDGVAVVHYDASTGDFESFDVVASAIAENGIPAKTTVAKHYELDECAT